MIIQRISSQNSEAARHRRICVVLAAACASLSAIPAVAVQHQQRVLGFVCIGMQVVLLIMAIRFLRATTKTNNQNQKSISK